MIKIAITGNIASGKTTVEKILEAKGYKVYDTDLIAHDILKNSLEVKKNFGTIDRKVIAKIVFTDKKKLELLESIIHPLVEQELKNIFKQNLDVVFVSVPQLFETGFDRLFDKIIYITARPDIRLKRLMKRNSLSEEDAMQRIKAQKTLQKKELSNYIIDNSKTIENLKHQVINVLEDIIKSNT